MLYVALFGASVFVLLAFIYWKTVAVIDRQTSETIEADILALSDVYRQRGIPGLVEAIRERAGQDALSDNVYLLTDPALKPLAGNVAAWPADTTGASQWISLVLTRKENGQLVPHQVRARTFTLPGDHHLLVGRDMHEKVRFRQLVIDTLSWSLGGTLGLGLLGGYLLSQRMMRRLDRTSRTIGQIMQGDLGRRLPRGSGGDEFDRLAEQVNSLLDQIERLMAGMQLATDSLAHDLRSPLTRLKARIELALIQAPHVDQDREALSDVLSQADAALVMFDNLLKIASAESGLAAADLKPIDAALLARDATELYEPVAEDKGVSLSFTGESELPVRGQSELLSQAITNLIDNAVKHTPTGGHIAVRAEREGKRATLVVADSGAGIAPADRARVLERFVRLETSRSTPGSGLGLSLVAAVVKLHGGTIALADNCPGLRVILSFPLTTMETEQPLSEAA